jgi:DNA mismatch repair protein MLH3
MPLQLLSENVRSRLRSGFAIASLAQCTEELVLNSIDAKASRITVQVDVPHFMIKVSDNGEGIVHGDLHLIGERYVTSKCHTLEELHQLHYYGYRGEALASIINISGSVEISSRHRLSNETYCKAYHCGANIGIKRSNFHLASQGTTITAKDVFYSLPVRKRSLSDLASAEVDKIRRGMASIGLIHPSVELSVYDHQTGKCLLQTVPANSLIRSFTNIYGRELGSNLKELTYHNKLSDRFVISGYVSTDGHHNKSLQFVYVNKRIINKSKLHSHINALLANSLITSNSLQKDSDRYGVYILNIECSHVEYDMCFDPVNSAIEFTDWDDVLNSITKSVNHFLRQHNLHLGVTESKEIINTSSSVDISSVRKSLVSSDVQYGLYSKAVKRSLDDHLLSSCDKVKISLQVPMRSPLNPTMNYDNTSLKRRKISKSCSGRSSTKLDLSHSPDDSTINTSTIEVPSPVIEVVNKEKSHDVDDNIWQAVQDHSHSTIYLNKFTGNMQYDRPVDDHHKDSMKSGGMDRSYGSHPLRAAPHLTHGYSPLAPRPKHLRLHSSNTTNTDLMPTESILTKWSNPALTGIETEVLNIGKSFSHPLRHHEMLHSYRFTSSMLEGVKVLGQVDNKFIACKLQIDQNKDLLVLFDQHAVHERIRLESLIQDAYDSNKTIKSSQITPPLKLTLTQQYRSLARTFTKQLESVGVKMTHKDKGMLITALPTPIVNETCKDTYPSVATVTTFILKQLETFNSVSDNCSTVPSTIHRILSSQACHGAIKFGDSLTLKECSDLINSLSKCNLPFQCAHGRPSLVPVIDLQLLDIRFPMDKRKTKLNFNNLNVK